MSQDGCRSLGSVRFEEHYAGALRKVRILEAWPQRIEEVDGFWPTHCRLEGNLLRIHCSNGGATYRQEGSDARHWRGVLIETTGENPSE